MSCLKKIRDRSETEFKKIFDDTTNLGRTLHGELFELKKPRTTGRQTQRSNVNVNSAEDYFRITLFDEFVSHVVVQLQEHFIDNPGHDTTCGLMYLLPQKCIDEDGVPPRTTYISC